MWIIIYIFIIFIDIGFICNINGCDFLFPLPLLIFSIRKISTGSTSDYFINKYFLRENMIANPYLEYFRASEFCKIHFVCQW